MAYDDDLHHFMQDCWHLRDWIMYDPLVLAGIRKSIEKKVLDRKFLRIVADLATASKHLKRWDKKRKGAYVTSTNVTVHLGQERPIDVDYVVPLSDGTSISADSVVREAVNDWDELLRKLRLIQ